MRTNIALKTNNKKLSNFLGLSRSLSQGLSRGLSLGLSLVLGFALVVTMACSKTNDAATQAGGQTDKEIKTLELRAIWKGPCTKANLLFDLFGFPTQTSEVDFGSSLSKTTTLFREDNCQIPAIRIVEHGTYVLGDRTAANIYTLNVHYESVNMTPLNNDGMATLNTIHSCGFVDWQINQSKDVTTNSSATPVISRCWSLIPSDVYDIVMFTGPQIKFGLIKDDKDKTTLEKRPTEIDESYVLAR